MEFLCLFGGSSSGACTSQPTMIILTYCKNDFIQLENIRRPYYGYWNFILQMQMNSYKRGFHDIIIIENRLQKWFEKSENSFS